MATSTAAPYGPALCPASRGDPFPLPFPLARGSSGWSCPCGRQRPRFSEEPRGEPPAVPGATGPERPLLGKGRRGRLALPPSGRALPRFSVTPNYWLPEAWFWHPGQRPTAALGDLASWAVAVPSQARPASPGLDEVSVVSRPTALAGGTSLGAWGSETPTDITRLPGNRVTQTRAE